MKTNRLSNNCKPDESVSEEEIDTVIDSEYESWEKEEQCISVEDVPEVGAHDSDDASADSCDESNSTSDEDLEKSDHTFRNQKCTWFKCEICGKYFSYKFS